MNKGLLTLGLIMLGLGAFVASVDRVSSLPTAFLVVGVVLLVGSGTVGRSGR